MGKEGEKLDSSTTIGPLYNEMMRSSDPNKWLQDNAPWLSKDELTTLYNLLTKKDSVNLADILKGIK
jgi:hypothetical protein